MGQKVHPNGLRIGINKDWQSKWYAPKKDFAKNLLKDIKIREFLEKELKNASISKIEIHRNEKRTEVLLFTSKPGLIIGRGGEEIERLKKAVSKIADEAVQISVTEVKNPNIDAKIVADSIARQLEGRASFRRVLKKSMEFAMRGGAKGIKTLVSGRLNGVEMARSEGYTEGNVPLHTLRADVDYAAAEAHTIYGVLGVKVWIYKGEILDKKQKGAE